MYQSLAILNCNFPACSSIDWSLSSPWACYTWETKVCIRITRILYLCGCVCVMFTKRINVNCNKVSTWYYWLLWNCRKTCYITERHTSTCIFMVFLILCYFFTLYFKTKIYNLIWRFHSYEHRVANNMFFTSPDNVFPWWNHKSEKYFIIVKSMIIRDIIK